MGAEVRTRNRNRDGVPVLIVYWRDSNGKRHVAFDDDQKVPFGPDTPENRKRAEAVRLEKDGVLPPVAHAPTLAGWAREWLQGIEDKVVAGLHSSQTFIFYRKVVHNAILDNPIGRMNINVIRKRNVKNWVGELMRPIDRGGRDYAPGTAAAAVKVLHTCLEAAIDDEFRTVEGNPVHGVMKSFGLERDLTVKPPSLEVTTAMLATMEEGARGAIQVVLFLGLRIGEAYGLQWADIDFDAKEARIERQVYPGGEIAQPKSWAGKRVVEIPDSAIRVFRAMKAAQGAEALAMGRTPSIWVLGVEPKDNTASRRRLWRAWHKAKLQVGYGGRVWLHGVRHTYAVSRVQIGGNDTLLTLKNAMGHASIQVTIDLYARHAQPRDQKNADMFGERVTGGVVPFKAVSDGKA